MGYKTADSSTATNRDITMSRPPHIFYHPCNQSDCPGVKPLQDLQHSNHMHSVIWNQPTIIYDTFKNYMDILVGLLHHLKNFGIQVNEVKCKWA